MIDFARICKWIEQQHRDHKEEHAQNISFLGWRERGRRSTEHVGSEPQKRKGEPNGENGESVEEGVEAQDEAKAYYLSTWC
jgi:hypothetical protein